MMDDTVHDCRYGYGRVCLLFVIHWLACDWFVFIVARRGGWLVGWFTIIYSMHSMMMVLGFGKMKK